MRRSLIASSTLLALALPLAPALAVPISFNYTGGFQSYAVADTGSYIITAFGGKGGTSSFFSAPGGLGAEASGTVTLTAGEVLSIIVGGRGTNGTFTSPNAGGGGGGGGSFVIAPGSSLLVAAGGGGGGGSALKGSAGLGRAAGGDGLGTFNWGTDNATAVMAAAPGRAAEEPPKSSIRGAAPARRQLVAVAASTRPAFQGLNRTFKEPGTVGVAVKPAPAPRQAASPTISIRQSTETPVMAGSAAGAPATWFREAAGAATAAAAAAPT